MDPSPLLYHGSTLFPFGSCTLRLYILVRFKQLTVSSKIITRQDAVRQYDTCIPPPHWGSKLGKQRCDQPIKNVLQNKNVFQTFSDSVRLSCSSFHFPSKPYLRYLLPSAVSHSLCFSISLLFLLVLQI